MDDMSNELPPQYNPKDVEEKIYKLWEGSGFFNPDTLPGRRTKKFSIAIAPPNVTGSLHMGHALEYTTSDVLVRYHRMRGRKTLWLPGMDHAGIATQNVVEKDLKKKGISRHDLGRERFLEKVWEWKAQYGNTIVGQLKTLGASADWSRLRFTMDTEYQEAVREAFVHYYKKGWIYRGKRTVNWCARCATSLSDLEIEYKEAQGKFYYIKYGPVTLGTVRPETKLGDTALAVNPKDARYKKYVGKEITIQSVDPSVPREKAPQLKDIQIKVVADKAADPEFGTGVIKVTPAHDNTDFEIYQRHTEIPIVQVIGENGRMTKEAGVRYEGLKVAEAREQIVGDLEKLSLMDYIEDYTHNVALCYRCGTTIEPLLSTQWFVKMDELAKKAISAVKLEKVRFYPKRWEKLYFDWLKNIKDWCISRQIWWGHRLPVWFCKKQTGRISNFQFPISKQIQNSKFKIQNSSVDEFVVSAEAPKICPFCKQCTMEQSADVLDTWFSSALWPFATLGWPKKTKDLKTFYPTDVNTNDRGIINLWDARMIFSGLEFTKKAPFRDNIVHATILTKDGRRMSKSLGTGIDPMDLIGRYGADATRFGLVWQAMGSQDLHWSEEHVVAGKKFANKIWNSARFVLMQIEKSEVRNSKFKLQNSKHLTPADKKILKALEKIKKELITRIEKYEFGQALHILYDFYWHEYCDIYLEASKVQMTNDELQMATKEILFFVLTESLKFLHPFMPFVTEEIWSNLPIEDKKTLIVEEWPR